MMESESIKRTLHWSLRHMLDDRDPHVRCLAARDLMKLDDVHSAELRDIVIKVDGDEQKLAFERLLATRSRDAHVKSAFCDILWNVAEFADRSAQALLESEPDRNTYHAVIGAKHVSAELRRNAWELLRPTVDCHDVIRLHDAACKRYRPRPSERYPMPMVHEAFEALLERGATNEDLRVICLYVAPLRERTWKMLLECGPTKEDLEWTARSNSYKWDEAKALLAIGAYVDALA